MGIQQAVTAIRFVMRLWLFLPWWIVCGFDERVECLVRCVAHMCAVEYLVKHVAYMCDV